MCMITQKLKYTSKKLDKSKKIKTYVTFWLSQKIYIFSRITHIHFLKRVKKETPSKWFSKSWTRKFSKQRWFVIWKTFPKNFRSQCLSKTPLYNQQRIVIQLKRQFWILKCYEKKVPVIKNNKNGSSRRKNFSRISCGDTCCAVIFIYK